MSEVRLTITDSDQPDLIGKSWITDEDGNHRTPADLSFARLRDTNVTRCTRWHPGFPNDGWIGSDWSNAAAGEMGEACNVVKKLRRLDHGTPGALDPDAAALLDMLGDEIADTVIYLDLLAAHYGINLAEAVVRKFDAVSVRESFPERLG